YGHQSGKLDDGGQKFKYQCIRHDHEAHSSVFSVKKKFTVYHKNLQKASSPTCTLSVQNFKIRWSLCPAAGIRNLYNSIFSVIFPHVCHHPHRHIHIFGMRKRIKTSGFNNDCSTEEPKTSGYIRNKIEHGPSHFRQKI